MGESIRKRPAIHLETLMRAGFLSAGDKLVWNRSLRHELHVATVNERGLIELADGRAFASPSSAAAAVAGGAYNGWTTWKVGGEDGPLLCELRDRLKLGPQ